jgi:uncharacterized protein (TIGR00730 family)
MIKSIAVFCGSSFGNNPCYREAAVQLAQVLAEKNIALIYGGATVGLMGVIADAAVAAGAKVIGVIPKALADIEISHTGLTQLHIVDDMHERKALIASLADGFILFPGAAGSLEEFFEVYTWAQLGLHKKPCGILNVNNYYGHLLDFLNHSVSEGFLKIKNHEMIFVETRMENLLEKFANYHAPDVKKWILDDA